MNVEALREYGLSKPGATESFPFGPETLVLKAGGKVFALISLDAQPTTLNLKCDPERAIQLREEYDAVQPGYHQNKQHWNTVILGPSLRWSLVQEWIDHSYDLVYQGLSKSVKAELNGLTL